MVLMISSMIAQTRHQEQKLTLGVVRMNRTTAAAPVVAAMTPTVMAFPIQTTLARARLQHRKTMLTTTVAPTRTAAAQAMAAAAERLTQTTTA